MKDTIKLNACIPYRLDEVQDIVGWLSDQPEIPEHLLSIDPRGDQWSSRGFMKSVRVGTNSVTYCVQFNDRILPAKVRDEHLDKKVAELADREGRKPGKREYAELREQVEALLLPQAFIRRSLVHVSITDDLMLIWTSSFKKADEVVALLMALVENSASEALFVTTISTRSPLSVVLTDIASDTLVHEVLEKTDSAVLKSDDDSRTIRVKDRDIDAGEVQGLLDAGYIAHELGLKMANDASFSLTEKLAFKKLKVDGTADIDDAADAAIWLSIASVTRALGYVIEIAGGEMSINSSSSTKLNVATTEEPVAVAEDDL